MEYHVMIANLYLSFFLIRHGVVVNIRSDIYKL